MSSYLSYGRPTPLIQAKAARFLSFYEKAQKKLIDILKYEYNFTSLIPFKSINLWLMLFFVETSGETNIY